MLYLCASVVNDVNSLMFKLARVEVRLNSMLAIMLPLYLANFFRIYLTLFILLQYKFCIFMVFKSLLYYPFTKSQYLI